MKIMTDTLLIPGKDIRAFLSIPECISAVENIFKLRALNKVAAPGIFGIHAAEGGFHIKAGIAKLNANYFVSKTNANFPKNKIKTGMQTIQGIIVVSDADNGRLLALMDSAELTITRTGAATAVAAKYLSRKHAATACIAGCGNQGRISVQCLAEVRSLKKIYLYDIDKSAAINLSTELRQCMNIEIVVIDDLSTFSKECDIIVTCTSATQYFLEAKHVSPGTFIAAVGADSEQKQELEPQLIKSSKVITDSTEQCMLIGELHHAIAAGLMTASAVYATLGEVIAGLKAGREHENEIIVFDSTGTALQDIAAASIVYEKAAATNAMKLNFA